MVTVNGMSPMVTVNGISPIVTLNGSSPMVIQNINTKYIQNTKYKKVYLVSFW